MPQIFSLLMKGWACFLSLGLFALLSSCASLEGIDRSNLNHPAMDLRAANNLGEPSPSTGLRQLRKVGGGETCTVCAH